MKSYILSRTIRISGQFSCPGKQQTINVIEQVIDDLTLCLRDQRRRRNKKCGFRCTIEEILR